MSDIILSNIHKRFEEKVVLNGFQLILPKGSFTALMGPSGCGKTTLLSILLGLLPPDRGECMGVPSRIAAVFQEDRLCETFSAIANLRLVTGTRISKASIVKTLGELGLTGESITQPVCTLSGGMKRRVAIARALLYDAELIVMDEPFRGLDERTKDNVMACVKQYCQGKTLLLVTHDAQEAHFFTDRVLLMPSSV